MLQKLELNLIKPNLSEDIQYLEEFYSSIIIPLAIVAKKLGFKKVNTNCMLAKLALNNIGVQAFNTISNGPTISFDHINNNPNSPNLIVKWEENNNVIINPKITFNKNTNDDIQKYPEFKPIPSKILIAIILGAVALEYLIMNLDGHQQYRLKNIDVNVDINIYGGFSQEPKIFFANQEMKLSETGYLSFKVPLNNPIYPIFMDYILNNLYIERKELEKSIDFSIKAEKLYDVGKVDSISFMTTAGGVGSFKVLVSSLLPIREIELYILDRDIIEPENFHTQLYDSKGINKSKSKELKQSFYNYYKNFKNLDLFTPTTVKINTVVADIHNDPTEILKYLNNTKKKYIFLNFDNNLARIHLAKLAAENKEYNVIINEASNAMMAYAKKNSIPRLKEKKERTVDDTLSCSAFGRLDDLGRASPITNLIAASAGLLISLNDLNNYNLDKVNFITSISTREIELVFKE